MTSCESFGLFVLQLGAGHRVHKSTGDVEAMPGSEKSLQLLLLFVRWRHFTCKWTDALATGKIFGGGEGAFFHMFACNSAIAFADLSGAHVFIEPPFAIAAPDEGAASCLGKFGVVDIAGLRKILDQRDDIGLPFTVPSTFADFAH